MDYELLKLPQLMLSRLDVVYTFLLVMTRFFAFFMFVPGIGGGERGVIVRAPAALILSAVSMVAGKMAPLPPDWGVFSVGIVSELIFGSLLGMIPMVMISAVQTGAQIASSSMGLGANQLLDPTTGASVADLSRLFGDLTVLLFLAIGGHHLVIHAVCGMSGVIVPGSFAFSEPSITMLIDRTAEIFRVGAMISAPVVVALLLTQFVMGLIARAVPTVNVFIISFPVTIGIGLILSVLALPDIMVVMQKEMSKMEGQLTVFIDDHR